MVYVEKRKENKKTLYYLTKSYRVKGKIKKKRVFLGTNLSKEQLFTLINDAKITLGEINFDKILSSKELIEFETIKISLKDKINLFEKNNFYQNFISEFTYDSNAIEGSSLTLEETNNLLFEGISPKNKPLIHLIEAKNHKESYDYTLSLKQNKLSTPLICKIQKIVVKNTLPEHLKNQEGQLRTLNVKIGEHVAPPHFFVPRKLKNIITWYNKNSNKYHPIIVAAYFHSEFESIHPFIDGNGRTGRLLINFMLTKQNYPPVIIFLKYRAEYFDALKKARENKNLKPLINIIKKCYKTMEKKYNYTPQKNYKKFMKK